MKIPKRSVSWTTFVEVFYWDFNAVLGACFIGLSVVFYVIFLFVNGETTIGFDTSFATVFLSFVGLEIPVDPNRLPGKAILALFCIIW